MNFIESAIIMVPALTGMALTVYDGEAETLDQFELRNCFSYKMQPIFTQRKLSNLLDNASNLFIYDVEDALGVHLIIVQTDGHWILLGPFVQDSWNEKSARLLLMRLHVSETVLPKLKTYRCKFPIVQRDYALKTALLIVEHLGNESRTIKTIRLTQEVSSEPFTFSDEYANISEIDQRYLLQDHFMRAIIHGDVKTALQAKNENDRLSMDLKYFNDSSQDQLVSTTVIRTIIRISAQRGGLSPVFIDATMREFAQKMYFAPSQSVLDYLMTAMIERFCSEIRKQRELGYSPLVRKAIDYMEINLSKPMTTTEIARAVGIERKSFVKQFRRETKKTVKEYIANRRCIIAADLFLNSKASVQDVAAYVGYPDSNYFSKVFKANMGVSPQAYRDADKA